MKMMNHKKKKLNNLDMTSISTSTKVNRIIDELMESSIPAKKFKSKIGKDEFCVPVLRDFRYLLDYNYNLQQLKHICKFYKMKLSGNKEELTKRCYNHLYYSHYAIYIQKIARANFIKCYNYFHGPAYIDRTICVNATDFGTFDLMKDIPYNQFYSFADDRGLVYGFDITSFYNLYLKANNKTAPIENPYTTKVMPKSAFDTMIYLIKYSNMLKIDVKISLDVLHKVNEEKELDIRTLAIF